MAKLLNADWSMKGVFFFLMLLVKRAKLLANDWSRFPSNSLSYRELAAKKISVTMTSPFEIVDEKYIEELKDKNENETGRKVRNTGRAFSKSGRMKETSKQIKMSTRAMSSTKQCRSFMPSYEKKTGMTTSATA